jgi:ribonuclease T1
MSICIHHESRITDNCNSGGIVKRICFLITGTILSLQLSCIFGSVSAAPCEQVVRELNRNLSDPVDERELVAIIRTLNWDNNRRLPFKFVTRRQALRLGWRPGRDLWAVEGLRGRSIGGDIFQDREQRLPGGGKTWREADLDYKGGRRGAKRLVYSMDGIRMVTVDHYRNYREVPACR